MFSKAILASVYFTLLLTFVGNLDVGIVGSLVIVTTLTAMVLLLIAPCAITEKVPFEFMTHR